MIRRIARHRKYVSGTGWCVWRWTDVATEYITRLHVLKTPWFAVCLHWLNTPDPDPHLHDHPVSFLSLILRGRYEELRPPEVRGLTGYHVVHAHRWWNFISAKTQHRIRSVVPGTLTLCLMGPKVQEWGFYVPGRGKVWWKTYYAEQRERGTP